MPYVDVASAVNRWFVTDYMRNQLVNSLLRLVDLKYSDGNKNYEKSDGKRQISFAKY